MAKLKLIFLIKKLLCLGALVPGRRHYSKTGVDSYLQGKHTGQEDKKESYDDEDLIGEFRG